MSTTGTIPGTRIIDMPDLGGVTDSTSFVAEKAGSGRMAAPALQAYAGRGSPAPGSPADWLTPLINWPSTASAFYQLSPDGRMAITGASDTAHGAALPYPVAIGVSGFGFNNLAGGGTDDSAWGGYFEARQYPGVTAAATFGVEIEIANVSGADSPYSTPYSFAPAGTYCALIGSGAGVSTDTPALTAYSATAAICINANESDFITGISFQNNAIAGTNGSDGNTGNAIALATGHVIQWWQNAEDPGGYIYSAQTTGQSGGIVFQSDGTRFQYGTSPGLVALIGNTAPAAAGTVLHLLVSNNAGVNLVTVSLGEPDSGGTGFRALIVPN
jgi:hypothetical protein